ncbi:hypothetical protein CON06_26425 [Bacillus cereus]|nr:hypothetical protein CON06_26425 [Bacillus cereus]PFM34506.1 hypothetical protein COJ43_24415 [Bacillus cereus]
MLGFFAHPRKGGLEKKLKWKSGEITAVMFMEMLELKKNTFYKIMKEYTEANYPLIYREC